MTKRFSITLLSEAALQPSPHFAVITGEDYSYVEEIRDMPGTFRFHRLMERALIKNQSAKSEDRAVARQRIDVILPISRKGRVFETGQLFPTASQCIPERDDDRI